MNATNCIRHVNNLGDSCQFTRKYPLLNKVLFEMLRRSTYNLTMKPKESSSIIWLPPTGAQGLGKGNSAQASTAQKSSDKEIYAALASTLKSPIALMVANRNPSEIEKGKRRKRKRPALRVWIYQWPLRRAEQDHQDRPRRPQRDLSMVKVDDTEAEARYSRIRTFQARVKRRLELSD